MTASETLRIPFIQNVQYYRKTYTVVIILCLQHISVASLRVFRILPQANFARFRRQFGDKLKWVQSQTAPVLHSAIYLVLSELGSKRPAPRRGRKIDPSPFLRHNFRRIISRERFPEHIWITKFYDPAIRCAQHPRHRSTPQ